MKPYSLIFIILVSLITSIYSLIHIYQLVMNSSQSLVILDPEFWLWTTVAWISAYVLIKTWIRLTAHSH